MSPPYPAPRLLTAYLLHGLLPTLLLLVGGSSLFSFHPFHTKVPPYLGELQDDFSPWNQRSAPRQIFTVSKCCHPVLAPTPPLQREKPLICTAAGPIPAFAVSHPSLEAIPAWAWAGRSEPRPARRQLQGG